MTAQHLLVRRDQLPTETEAQLQRRIDARADAERSE